MGLVQRFARRKMHAIDDRRWAMIAHYMTSGEKSVQNTPCHYVFNDAPPENGFIFLTDAALYMFASRDGLAARIPNEDLHEVMVAPDGYHVILRHTNRNRDEVTQALALYPSPISTMIVDLLAVRLGGLTRLDG